MYLNAADELFDAGLVHAFLRRLRAIESWFVAQSSYHFIASSLLFVYCSQAVNEEQQRGTNGLSLSLNHCTVDSTGAQLSNGCEAAQSVDVSATASSVDGSYTVAAGSGVDVTSPESWWDQHVDVKMIDFTHAFTTTSHDDNYLAGLRSVITYLSHLRPGTYVPDPL